jgi:8-oxo-dGTP pyrophosphatase MutT (NUDIX family)
VSHSSAPLSVVSPLPFLLPLERRTFEMQNSITHRHTVASVAIRMTTSIRIIFIMITSILARYGNLCSGFLQHQRRPIARFLSSKSSLPTEECPLQFETGPYSAAEVTVEKIGNDDEFLDRLDRSIDFWKANDFTSAWVSVPTTRARLIEHLSSSEDGNEKYGFDLHHTNATMQTIVMKKWLQDGTEDKIPPFATHQVGCAGFVLNDQNEILLVKEWSGPSSNRTPTQQWKMPGGLLDAGESFEEATCREVLEETGVPCEFESILTFWHRHGLQFGKSDLYYVCLLQPKSSEIDLCPVEISAARWMAVDEFLATQNHPLITHVLRNNFLLDASCKVGNSKRIAPSADIMTGAVQWPNRPPYPTYTSTIRK